MKEFTPDEINRYHQVRKSWLSLAECWFSNGDCQKLRYLLSEPNRFALKLSQKQLALELSQEQNERVVQEINNFNSLSLAKRKSTLRKAYASNNFDARRGQTLMRYCLSGLSILGYRGYTLKKLEDEMANLFNDCYSEIKGIFEKEFPFISMSDIVGDRLDVGATMVTYFWESLVAGKELPLTPTVKQSLGIDKDGKKFNAIDSLNSLVTLVLVRDKAGKLTSEARRFARSVILSWFNEEYQKNRGRISKDAINKAIMEGVMHKATAKEDSEGNLTIIGPEDRGAEEDFEQADRYLLLKNVLEVVTDPLDRKALELKWAYELGDLSDGGYEKELAKSGLTEKAVDHRLRDLARKYPMLQQLKN